MSRISIAHTIGAYQSTRWVGEWQSGEDYVLKQQVGNGGDLFICKLSHTSAAGSEPGAGVNWETYWTRQVDIQPFGSYTIDGGII